MRLTFIDYEEEEEEEESDSFTCKNVFFIGFQKSGKTSIITRLAKNEFTLYYTPTRAIQIFQSRGFTFYEIPYTYEFHHKFFIQANIVCIVDQVDDEWWQQFLKMIDPKIPMEVLWLTQKSKPDHHRLFTIDCLENTGFESLRNALISL